MATACRCGLPEAISLRILADTAFLLIDLIRGIGLFSMKTQEMSIIEKRGRETFPFPDFLERLHLDMLALRERSQ